MSLKTKQNLTLAAIAAGWLLIFFFFIDLKSRAALVILPIFTVFALIYLAYVTFWGVKRIENLGDVPEDKQSEKTETK